MQAARWQLIQACYDVTFENVAVLFSTIIIFANIEATSWTKFF
jgi:hypothetical protein